MRVSWRSLVNRLLERGRDLLRSWERFASERRIVLAITRDERCRTALRVLAIEERWHLLFASCTEGGLFLCAGGKPCVVIYDMDTCDLDWRAGLINLSELPAFPIVIGTELRSHHRPEAVSCGAWDVTRKPLDPNEFVPLVNSALCLAESIERLGFPRDYSSAPPKNPQLSV